MEARLNAIKAERFPRSQPICLLPRPGAPEKSPGLPDTYELLDAPATSHRPTRVVQSPCGFGAGLIGGKLHSAGAAKSPRSLHFLPFMRPSCDSFDHMAFV